MPKYVVLREFEPDLWDDEGFDKTGYMLYLLRSALDDQGLVPVGEPEVQFSINLVRLGWGAGRAAVEVQ